MSGVKKTNGLILSFILGGAIGSIITLLYAPKSGKHLRKDISRKTNELIDEGKKITTKSWNSVKEMGESSFESAGDLLKTGMEKITGKTDKVKDAVNSGYNAFKDEIR